MTHLGQTLGGRYRLDAALGSGGMATVFRAWDLRLDRPVAVKILAPGLAADPSFVARFRQEARTMARVHHPSIVTVFDVDESDGLLYIVMELIDGESLADRLQREHVLSPEALAPILSSVASGLAALHELGLIHRDIKPHNILLPAAGPAQLADFGLARDGGTTTLTLPGTAIGTLGYLAPELLQGAPATPASDVYAFGVVAYEALTGQRPVNAVPPPPSALATWLGTGFDRPLAAALGPAAGRPSITALSDVLVDASDDWARGGLAGMLERTQGSRTTTLVAATSVSAPAPAGRTGLLVALFVAAGLILVVIAAWSLASAPGAPAVPSPTPTVAASTPVPTSSPSPTASPSPIPSATPAPSTAAQIALGALDAFDSTVAALQGGPGGLKGKDAKSLTDLAGQVRSAVQRGDAQAARDATGRLVDQATRLARGLSSDAASRLTSAAAAVQEAVADL